MLKLPTVLVVDDDPMVRVTLANVLRRGRYSVCEAAGGVEALGILASEGEAITVLVLDIRMPEMSGGELVQHLLTVHPHVVGVVPISGYAESDALKAVIEAGSELVLASDFLPKPFTNATLLEKVDKTARLVNLKRAAMNSEAIGKLHNRLSRIEEVLARMELSLGELDALKFGLQRLEKGKPFLKFVGEEIARVALIGAFIASLLYFDVGALVRKLAGH